MLTPVVGNLASRAQSAQVNYELRADECELCTAHEC